MRGLLPHEGRPCIYGVAGAAGVRVEDGPFALALPAQPAARRRIGLGAPGKDRIGRQDRVDGDVGCAFQPSVDRAEILQAAAIAVKAKLQKADFDRTIALHPTMAEELVLMR
mgnify:CR=1 FL=1